MDGRQPHVRSPPVSGAPDAGTLEPGLPARSGPLGVDAGQRLVGPARRWGRLAGAPRGFPLDCEEGQRKFRRGSPPEGGEEIDEEDRQEVGEEVGEEVDEEDCREVREEIDEEDRREVREEVRRTAPRQEEGICAQCGKPWRADDPQAAGQEARASLTR